MPIALRWYEIRGIICRLELYNLQTKKYLNWYKQYESDFPKIAILKGLNYKVMLKLVDISKVKYSTHTICGLKKWLKKSWQGRIEFSINDSTKTLKYESYLSFRACQKTFVEFTDLTHTIYRPAKIAQIVANSWK